MADAFQYIFSSMLESHRYHHDIDHIIDLLVRARKYGDRNKTLNSDGTLVRPLYEAILFHDVVYDIIADSSISNEAASAEIYESFARDHDRPDDEIRQVSAMIRATEHHFDETEYDDYLTNFLLDIDLLGFSVPFDDFLDIQDKLDAEYQTVYHEEYVFHRRMSFLKDILDNKRLRYRVIDPYGILTEIAYNNIKQYLSTYYTRSTYHADYN